MWVGTDRGYWDGDRRRDGSDTRSGSRSDSRSRRDQWGVWRVSDAVVGWELPARAVGIPEDFEPPTGGCLYVVAPC